MKRREFVSSLVSTTAATSAAFGLASLGLGSTSAFAAEAIRANRDPKMNFGKNLIDMMKWISKAHTVCANFPRRRNSEIKYCESKN